MNIKCHRRVGANLNLFLASMGFKCVWNMLDKNNDELVVLGKYDRSQNRLLTAVKKEVEKTGYIPYHFSLVGFKKTKKKLVDTKVEFTGTILESRNIQNISGGFNLISFVSVDGMNYLWKCYRLEKEVRTGVEILVKGRLKGLLYLPDKSVINQINYVRIEK